MRYRLLLPQLYSGTPKSLSYSIRSAALSESGSSPNSRQLLRLLAVERAFAWASWPWAPAEKPPRDSGTPSQ